MGGVKIKISMNDLLIKKEVQGAVKEAMEDVLEDLTRTSSESAPHDKGVLDSSFAKEVKQTSKGILGSVSYSVIENGYNYAVKMHELDYNLGEKSLKKTGGTSGISGKSFPVGKKFLQNPFEESADAYRDYIEDKVKRKLK